MIAAIALAAAPLAAECRAPSGPQRWRYETAQYPHSGEILALRRDADGWRATVGSTPLAVRWSGSSVHMGEPGGAYFEGERTRKQVEGFWVEPKSDLDHSRAFRLRMTPVGTNRWQGTISPNEERLALDVWFIAKAGGDELLVRNPDGLVGDTRFRATVDGCTLALEDLNAADHRARLRTEPSGGAELEGLHPALAVVPLRPASVKAVEGDREIGDWPLASPESVDMDAALIGQLVEKIAAIDPANRGVPLIHSLLIARHGKLIAEHYFGGYSAERLHELRSASKSFASLLVGAARTNGVKLGQDTPIAGELPAYRDIFAAAPAKAHMTLGNLLAMRPGLDCDDFDSASPGGEDLMQSQAGQPDWYRYFLQLPVKYERGTHYAYCSGATHLAAGVVAQAAGRSALDAFDTWLAEPLSIRDYSMPLDPNGRAYFGGGMHLRPRDFLKFGQLLLNRGKWGGRQVVDRAWLDESTRCPTTEPECAEGLGWHFNTITANGRAYREIEANGNGGQLLMVLPELDVAVVFTAANFNAYPVWRKFREELTPNYIVAAVRR